MGELNKEGVLDKEIKVEDNLNEVEELAKKLAKDMAVELTNNAVATRVRELKEKHEREKEEAIKEALKKAQMTAEELEAEKIKELSAKNEELENKYNELVNSGIIKSKLSEAGLPQSDILVKSLLGSIDDIDTVIGELKENFDTELQKRVDEKLKTDTLEIKKESVDLKKSEKTYRNTASRIGIG